MRDQEFNFITAPRDRKGNLIVQRNKPMVRTPQFPGVKPGMDIEQVREVIRNQKRIKGFKFDLSVGANNDFDLELSGTARVFLGFALTVARDTDPADEPDQVTLVINNEIVIQEVFPEFFSSLFMDDEYYFLPRPLSGQDTITLSFNAKGDIPIYLVAYYI